MCRRSTLEEHLLTHPSIWAAAAVPVPDEYLGEKICAAVVFSGTTVTLPELSSYLDEPRGFADRRDDPITREARRADPIPPVQPHRPLGPESRCRRSEPRW
jgi:acyl-CoA synthetase (AMP-forming)/AMP-acid ligase II